MAKKKPATKKRSGGTGKPKPPGRKRPAPRRRAAPSAPAVDLQALDEELQAARGELARIGSEENAIKRDLEARLSEVNSGAERLRAELHAVHLDLKTALAELEIARAAEQRAADRAQALTRELTGALESQRRAEHAGDAARDEALAARTQLERVRGELQAARSELATLRPPSGQTA